MNAGCLSLPPCKKSASLQIFDTLLASTWKEPLFWLKYVDLKHILQGLQAICSYKTHHNVQKLQILMK